MLLRRRLMEQGPPQGLATIPSRSDFHMRQQQRVYAAQSFFPIGSGPRSAILSHPIYPATALFMESPRRANDLMMAEEARRLHQLRFAAAPELSHCANQRTVGVLRNAIQAPQLILGNSNQFEEEESEERESEDDDEKVDEDHSVDLSNDSKPQKGLRKVDKSKDNVNDEGKTDTKKDVKWLKSYEELKAYQKLFGDCVVPRGYSTNPRLASWVAEQRYGPFRSRG